MAKLKTIIPALRKALDIDMRAISLGMFTKDPFKMRSDQERTSQPIEQIPGGTPRLWQLDEPVERKQLTLGSPQRKWEFVFNIKILYPTNNAKWLTATDDDLDLIYDYLTQNSSTVAGVDIREPVFKDFPPEFTPIEGSKFQVVTCPIWAVIEIS